MPLFQDFGKKFADAAKVVSKRTAEATEVVRLNGRVSSLQDEIEHLFNQVGKAYYAMRNASGESEAAKALCTEIDKLNLELEAARVELDRIRNLRRCPNCGEVQQASAQFCASCGTKMPAPPAPDPEPEPEPEETAVRHGAEQPEVEIRWPKAEQPEPEQEAVEEEAIEEEAIEEDAIEEEAVEEQAVEDAEQKPE